MRHTKRQRERQTDGGGCQIKARREQEKLRDVVMLASTCFFFFFLADCLVGVDVLHHCLRFLPLSLIDSSHASFLLYSIYIRIQAGFCMEEKGKTDTQFISRLISVFIMLKL